ncbi:helix-turn-helix domain-containing protein [Deinococcus marmoris]|uniref:helix-turn-helix domain-containing protein n=1 Tax=Deinococcus marmoris TaxID=249408 RepID=UPI0011151F9C|nr:hypothetical protein [Deinococcus marmoris]
MDNSGKQRGEALKQIMRRHSLTVRGMAELCGVHEQTLAMLLNGGRTNLGRDLATRTSDAVAGQIAAAVGRLEPDWSDADLWEALSIPEARRGVWRLHRDRAWAFDGASEVQVDSTWGLIASDTPVRLMVMTAPTDAPGLHVWRTGRGAAILRQGEDPVRAEHLGTLAGLEPVD